MRGILGASRRAAVAAARAWRRRPLLVAGLGVALLGPLICWSPIASQGVLPIRDPFWPDVQLWPPVVGAYSIGVGWALIGAHRRPWGRAAAGAGIGAALYLVTGWLLIAGIAMFQGGHRPLDVLATWPDLVLLRIIATWPILLAWRFGVLPT